MVCSCRSGPGGGSGSHLRYSVKKSAPSGDSRKTHFVAETSIKVAGMDPQSSILAIYDTRWVVLTLGEREYTNTEIQVSADGEEPLTSDVGRFSGTILAIRCREGNDGKIEADHRVYQVREGQILRKEGSRTSLSEGQSAEFPLPW
jgi:hypothetical protein